MNDSKHDQLEAYIAKAEHCKTQEEWDAHVDSIRELVTPNGRLDRDLLLSQPFADWKREHFNKIMESTQRHFAKSPKEKTL